MIKRIINKKNFLFELHFKFQTIENQTELISLFHFLYRNEIKTIYEGQLR